MFKTLSVFAAICANIIVLVDGGRTLFSFTRPPPFVTEYAPIVNTTSGAVRGLVKIADQHRRVYFYEGIRFGQAERFSPPKSVEAWKDVYDATYARFSCPQPGKQISQHLPPPAERRIGELYSSLANEDCLYLNVWKPELRKTISQTNKLPVMVWIYGGGFITGTIFSEQHDGRYLAALGDVVVVAINYRVGAFGFLNGGTNNEPGNLGLRDQIFGLQWVRDNIANFGGDPAQVTIFGESAGSMSVGALALSPVATGLFHRAILQSGAPNSYLGSEAKEKSFNKTVSLANKYNCQTNNTTEKMIRCLRGFSTESILEVTQNSILDGESFIPIFGEEIMPQSFVTALRTGKFNRNIDLMFGVTSGEGSGFVAGVLPQMQPSFHLTLPDVKVIISIMFQLFRVSYGDEVAQYYTASLNANSSQGDLRRAVAEAFGDYHLVCPTIFLGEEMARYASNRSHYSYRLEHQSSNGCQGWMGVCHSEDVDYVFGLPHRNHIRSEADNKLSRDMMRAWTSFARDGNVNGIPAWRQAFADGKTTPSYLSLKPDQYHMVDGFYHNVCDTFWRAKIFA